MNTIAPVIPERYTNRYWKRFSSYQFASGVNAAPVVAAELTRAVQTLPLAFVRQKDRYILAAVLSPTAGENLFVGPDGRWLGGYVPAFFRGHPFRLVQAKDTDKLVLCVDEGSGLISDTEGEPFFDQEGRLSKSTQEVFQFLQQVESNRSHTQQAVDSLDWAGVILPWQPQVATREAKVSLSGLYRIDEKALENLDDQAFLALRSARALSIAYAQLYSMGNISVLDRLAKYHAQQAQKQASSEPDIEQLLGEDDILSFDNV